jgi:hypothetical protein
MTFIILQTAISSPLRPFAANHIVGEVEWLFGSIAYGLAEVYLLYIFL